MLKKYIEFQINEDNKSKNKRLVAGLISFGVILGIQILDNSFTIVSVFIIGLAVLFFFNEFEKKKIIEFFLLRK